VVEVMEGVMERGRSDGGRGSGGGGGRGSDGGGGGGGGGPSLSTVGACCPGVGGCCQLYALAIRQWALVVVHPSVVCGRWGSFGVLGVVRQRWVPVCGRRVVVCGLWGSFACGTFSWVGGCCLWAGSCAVHVRGWVVREWVVRGWVVICGHSGAVSCVV
jgi:hypothetical protein